MRRVKLNILPDEKKMTVNADWQVSEGSGMELELTGSAFKRAHKGENRCHCSYTAGIYGFPRHRPYQTSSGRERWCIWSKCEETPEQCTGDGDICCCSHNITNSVKS